MVFCDGLVQVIRAEIGPQDIHKHKFGISGLPQQEIAGPLLTGGTDDQLGVRHVGGVQVARQQFLRQLLRTALTVSDLLRKGPGCPDDLVPAAVVQAEIDLDLVVGAGAFLRLPAQLLQVRGQLAQVAEEAEADVVLLHIRQSFLQIAAQQTHDAGHLLSAALPVFRGEGVDRQVLDAQGAAVIGDFAEGFRTGGMAGGPGQAPVLGPAAIAVHDDGNVPGRGQIFVFRHRKYLSDKVTGGALRPQITVIANLCAHISALRAALRAVALRNVPAGTVVWQSPSYDGDCHVDLRAPRNDWKLR